MDIKNFINSNNRNQKLSFSLILYFKKRDEILQASLH